ncbi:OVARIAN TUMOR DOMAIN-containing deubiquitinating enzyme 4 [Linum perenne]
MLAVLRARLKPWISTSLANHFHGHSPTYYSRLLHTSPFNSSPVAAAVDPVDVSNSCRLVDSLWEIQFSASSTSVRPLVEPPRGEGSWNVAWDARPARWLHRPDFIWLLFGACHAPMEFWLEASAIAADAAESAAAAADPEGVGGDDASRADSSSEVKNETSSDYKVTGGNGAGVLADGRCLFRALAHGDCLRKGKEPPDGDLQRELADELRAQVADELLKRRKEVEGFIEEDLDTYIDRMQKPYVWGGEPELLMASHILKTVISVFMMDRTSEDLKSVASYGEEYAKDGENPINVLFHGYGHYDLLEGLNKRYQKVKA